MYKVLASGLFLESLRLLKWAAICFWIAMVIVLAPGCGNRGLAHLLAGLAIDNAIDQPAVDGTDGSDGAVGPAGLSCWDLNGNGIFDPDEDMDGDGLATAYDCRGPQGEAGRDGEDGNDGEDGADGVGLPGPPGPQGPPGVSAPDDDDDGPPFGHANGHGQ